MTLHTLRAGRPLHGIRQLIRADGTQEDLSSPLTLEKLRVLVGAESLEQVTLKHWGHPLHVMLLDGDGYEVMTIQHPHTPAGAKHFERVPTHARKPVNAEATRLYHANCRPGTTHQIVGDVVIVPDDDFADEGLR